MEQIIQKLREAELDWDAGFDYHLGEPVDANELKQLMAKIDMNPRSLHFDYSLDLTKIDFVSVPSFIASAKASTACF